VISRIDELAIAPAFSSGYANVRVGADLSAAQKDKLIATLRRRGADYVGQEVVSVSTMPVWSQGRLRPRPFQMRVFAAATENGWVVMPGGFCRVAAAPDARAISMQLGGMSADVWVLGASAADKQSLLPTAASIEVKRHFGALTARAADNLYWFGRYLERTEAIVRLVRAGHTRASLRDRGERDVGRAITRLLAEEEAIPAEATTLTRNQALAALTDLNAAGSAASSAAAARRTALSVRERFSVDVASAVEELAATLDAAARTHTDPVARADRAVRLCASIAGFVQENMVQLAGWRFLEIGRRLERALNTARAVEVLGLGDPQVSSLEALLELGDSSITYAQRYFVAAAQRPVIDLLVLDDSNPRSCAFQIRKLRELVSHLPGESSEEASSPARRLVERLAGEVAGADAKAVDAPFLERLSAGLRDLSDELSQRYLVNRERLAFSFRVDE
jgi:uncharacterized alpha-E superfamily protein